MELLSPAGTYEKLETAFAYGADAAYMGLKEFSMRANAGNFSEGQRENVKALKRSSDGRQRRLYCAINVMFHEDNIARLKGQLALLAQWPFDGFIVTDLGAATILKNAFPETELHLSTQASCLNSAAAKVYRDMGFSRIVLGREAPLDDIRRIKDAVPDLEIETFVHGAMCMAYSGRCLLSSHLTGRSGNQGDCAHTCRWNYRLMGSDRLDKLLASETLGSEAFALEEAERPGVYYPISEQDGFTTLLSSKDLCMIDHLRELQEAGVDSLKIEGRMKSLYYVALVTRAYRKAIDALAGIQGSENWKEFRDELFNISHREYSTGFFFGHGPVDPTMDDGTGADRIDGAIDLAAQPGYIRDYLFLGIVGDEVRPGIYSIDIRNQIRRGERLEYIGPDVLSIADDTFVLLDEAFSPIERIDHGKIGFIASEKPLKRGYLIRKPIE